MIDIHAHVLPGLDDGPANMGESIDLIRAAAQDNITTIVATPHMLDGVYNVPRDEIFAGVAALNDALKEHGIPVTILTGADVHVDTEIPALLRDGRLVTVAGRGKHIMLELPPDVVPGELDQLLYSVQLQGVRPVISHPERNRVIQEEPALLIPLVQAGSLMQITVGSIIGQFGSHVQDCAMALFERRMVHFVATDMHGMSRRIPRLSEAAAAVADKCGCEDAEQILKRNPEALIHGEYVDAGDPTEPKPRKRRFFFW